MFDVAPAIQNQPGRELSAGHESQFAERGIPSLMTGFGQRLRESVSAQTSIALSEPMARRTTLRVGGPADFLAEPASESDLAAILRCCREWAVPFTILGRGSNLLIRDRGIRGVVVGLSHEAFARIVVEGTRLKAGAGARLKHLAAEARRQGLSGLEFVDGIPGSLGGALRMNAGAMGAETFAVLESMRFMDCAGGVHESLVAEVPHSYRSCALLRDHIALSAVFVCQASTPEQVASRMETNNSKRWVSQPKEPSAGCVFKNPPGIPAGKLIEELGLKGSQSGRARVSEVHGNFIVNDGGATAADVLRLIEKVRDAARRHRGIELETEIQILGEA